MKLANLPVVDLVQRAQQISPIARMGLPEQALNQSLKPIAAMAARRLLLDLTQRPAR
jgi:hypothetical protein